MRADKLTAGQARYVQFRIAGERPQDAYAKAFPGAGERTLACKPYRLEKNPRVKAAIEAAITKASVKMHQLVASKGDAQAIIAAAGAAAVVAKEVVEAGLSRAEKRRILKRIATDKKASRIDRMRAIQVDNLMTGDNKPVRFEGEVTLHTIFKALAGTTGLPADGELIELDPKAPAVLPP